MRITRSPKALHFGIKCSKSCRFLRLRPGPRWGSLRHSLDPLITTGCFTSAIATSGLLGLQSHILVYRYPASRSQFFPLLAPLTRFLDLSMKELLSQSSFHYYISSIQLPFQIESM